MFGLALVYMLVTLLVSALFTVSIWALYSECKRKDKKTILLVTTGVLLAVWIAMMALPGMVVKHKMKGMMGGDYTYMNMGVDDYDFIDSSDVNSDVVESVELLAE